MSSRRPNRFASTSWSPIAIAMCRRRAYRGARLLEPRAFTEEYGFRPAKNEPDDDPAAGQRRRRTTVSAIRPSLSSEVAGRGRVGRQGTLDQLDDTFRLVLKRRHGEHQLTGAPEAPAVEKRVEPGVELLEFIARANRFEDVGWPVIAELVMEARVRTNESATAPRV